MELTKYKSTNGAEIALSVDIVRNVICNGNQLLTDAEILEFIDMCKYNGLNPFLKEAYLVKYKGKNGDKCSIIVSKETFLKRAESNPDYDGSKSGIIVLRNGEITKVVGTLMLQGDTLLGGWAEVYRKSWKMPTEITVSLAEYHKGNSMWNEKPATMIRKVALMQALREAFSNQLGACYEESEVMLDTTATVVESKPPQATEPAPTEAKAIAPKDDKCFKGMAKVKTHLVNNNLKGAMDGMDWLKATYPDKDFSELQKMIDAKVKAMDI